jgi:hypothetical protein
MLRHDFVTVAPTESTSIAVEGPDVNGISVNKPISHGAPERHVVGGVA